MEFRGEGHKDGPVDSNTTFYLPLKVGNNIFSVTVTARDQKSKKHYKANILRPADVEARLSSLLFSTGQTEPKFNASGTATEFHTTVIYEIENVMVTPISVDINVQSIRVGLRGGKSYFITCASTAKWYVCATDAPCKVCTEGGGTFVSSGTKSPGVGLVNGVVNSLQVIVTAEDGVTRITYTNYITRPRYSRSQYERVGFKGEWRRSQHRDNMLLTLGGHWNPCNASQWQACTVSRTEGKCQVPKGDPSPFVADNMCRENSWELTTVDYNGDVHELKGWYEINSYQDPPMLVLDVMEVSGQYASLAGSRWAGYYRFTDWPSPATDGLSTDTRTHINVEMDLARCTDLQALGVTDAFVDNSIGNTGNIGVGAELLVKPESVGPGGDKPWDCPAYAQVLGNDTSHMYLQMLRDVDECLHGTHGCSNDSICTNTYGSRWCACKSGYAGNPYFDRCEDVDECAEGLHNCGDHTQCLNTPGSFNCTCDHGYEGNPAVYTFDVDVTPDGSIDVVKRPGQEWECVSVHQNHTCQRVPTVYPQRNGSIRGGRTGAVADPFRSQDQAAEWHFDDPFNSEYHRSSQHYYREKTDPAYVRTLTESVPYPPPRWHFDGTPAADNECSDVDECATEAHGCSDNGYCFNVPGAFSCHCHIGYVGDPYLPKGCTDVNECDEGSHACSSKSVCINIDGSHLCKCPESTMHSGQLFWHDRAPGKPYNSKCHMPLRQTRVFVTYERWTGEQVGTLAGADAKCHSEGPELQPGFRWKAVLSDEGTSARHHLTAGETNILFPVLRTDGELVAVDSDQLWNGLRLDEGAVRGDKKPFGLSNPINVDGSGAGIPEEPEWTGAHEVWTGSNINGEVYQHGSCWSWREQTSFAQNQAGGEGPSRLGAPGHEGGSIYAGHRAGTVDARSPIYAGDLWNYDGSASSKGSYGKSATFLPGGAGGSYGDLRSVQTQWHSGRDTLRECETKRRHLYCLEVHYSTESVMRDPAISPYGSHLNTTWFSASASTVASAKDIYPSHALDGNSRTFWQAHLHDADVWFQLDMHAHFTVTAVLLKWHAVCFPSAYSLMLSNSEIDFPTPPSSKFAGWQDPSWSQANASRYPDDPSWRIYHEVISRTVRGGDQRLEQPSLLSRAGTDRMLVKDPMGAVTAVSPPEVARHIRVMVTDPNDLLCHALTEMIVMSPEERPFGPVSESARRAGFRGLQGNGVASSHHGTFPRSSNPSTAKSSVDHGRSYNDRDAWPTPSDGSVAYTSGTQRHSQAQRAGFPQVTSHAPPGWEFLQQRGRVRATSRQKETRYDNMRHRYTQADSKLNRKNHDHPQWPCPPGVMSCDSFEPSSQEGHSRADMPRFNQPAAVNYRGAAAGVNRTGPSARYRPRGSQDGDEPPYIGVGFRNLQGSGSAPDVNESPLRGHNAYRGTHEEYDLRADTSASYSKQPTHAEQRKASPPELEGPQWKPAGPAG
jgi:hypothetical protein